MKPLSLSAYARHRGCTLHAVQEAIASGRLHESLSRNARGKVKIKSAAEADAEWEASTLSEHVPLSGPGAKKNGAAAGGELSAMRGRFHAARARMLELDLAEREGALVSRARVIADATTIIGEARNRLLGLPAQAMQRIPKLDRSDYATLDELVREVLFGLASGFQRKGLTEEKTNGEEEDAIPT